MYNTHTGRLVLLFLGVFCVAVRGQLRIINGDDTDPYEYPFMVRLLMNGDHNCGGSLIRSNIVLTAAHCVENNANYSVVVGDHVDGETGSHERVIDVSRKIIHEGYGRLPRIYGFFNDVALLELAENVTLEENIIETIALAKNEDLYEEGTRVTVIGWGDNENYTLQKVLQEVEYEVADQTACHKHWLQYSGVDLTEELKGQLCVLDPELKSSAYFGDSGGPLFVKSGENVTQIGMVSWGQDYEDGISYNMFTSTYHFLDWIEEKIALASVGKKKTLDDFIRITEVRTKMKKVKGSKYRNGKVNCMVEELSSGINVKSKVATRLYKVSGRNELPFEEEEEEGNKPFSMRHKKRWNSGKNKFNTKIRRKEKLTQENCLMCEAFLKGEWLVAEDGKTYAFSDSCPDY